MYTPQHHEETDLKTLHNLVRTHALGTWILQHEGELIANHIPFHLDDTHGIEIPIDTITGKWKMHQHRSDAEKFGVVAGLMNRGDDDATAIAAMLQQQLAIPK